MKKIFFIYRLFLIYALFVYFSTTISAQIPDVYSYQYYNTSHGLPSSEIISLAKDNKGFLWLGTSAGLSMYDGYSFQNHPFSKENELIGSVNVIKPFSENRLWIGSATGLFCLVNNEIIKISAATSLPQGVNDILPDKDGTLWLATENGPVKFNMDEVDLTGKRKMVLTDYLIKEWKLKNEPVDKRRTLLISKAPDGTVYIAQHNNLFRLSDDKLELIYVITETNNRVLSLFPISKTKIYFDASFSELNKIEHGVVTKINLKKFYTPGAEDSLNGIWYAGTNGVFYFHPETGTVSVFYDLLAKGVLWPTALVKEDDFLWVGSHDGLIKIKPSIFTVYDVNKISPYPDYHSLIELQNGNLLLGTNRGNIFEKKGSLFRPFKKKLFPTAEIKCFYEDERGWLWAGSGYQGLTLIRNNKAERFTIENGLHDNSLYQFIKTGNGKLYVLGDQGISEILSDKNNTVSFRKYYYQPNISQHAKFFSGIEAPDGSIWMGGEEGIVYLRNDSLHLFTFNGKQHAVNFLIKDKEEKIWIATPGEGILQCEFNKKHELEIIKQWNENDGMNTLNYLTLLVDKDNNIWAGSSKGLSFIGQQGKYKGKILNFGESDGFIKPGYSFISLYQVSDGSIWAATIFGFASFKPSQLLISNASPLVYITGIRQIKRNEFIISNSFQQYPSKNEFSYSNNSFNFNFTSLDYVNQENIRYYYKLDGLNTNWTNSGSLRSISFENLSPGKYFFRVKALNSKGIWSKQDAVYSFVINAPFWQLWWFISAVIIAAFSLVFYLFKRKERATKLKFLAKEKEMEVIQLNHDLAGSQLTVLRTQMNPHFIFNALNSVQQYILQGNVMEANKYLSKFSKLQREILHCSSHNFISLEKEIEILNAYLQLEQLRFGDSFTYDISMTDKIEPAEIYIPPMMLQPFVENAIWHGLMPKQGERTLNIYFDLYTDDILLATIRDNGIGRDASAKLKQNNRGNITQHESKGMSMVDQRLQLLQQQYNKPFEVSVSDITDVNGMVQGTQAALKIFIGNKK